MADVHSFEDSPNKPYLYLLDGLTLLSLAALVLYTVSKHEPWADEAQAWLVARDYPWWKLLFTELRYEGHPPLWFAILALAIHAFHLSYAHIGYLGGAIAITGLGVLIFLAPFPRLLRYLIGFSFFFVYQYAVLARPYVLMPLLGFLAAYYYRKSVPRITAFAIVVALLVQVSSYAALIGVSLTVFYAWQLAARWGEISAEDHRRIIRAGILVALSVIFFFVVLYPPPDSFLVAQSIGKTFQNHLQLVGEGVFGALADSAVLAIALLLVAGTWAHERRGLWLLIMSVGGTGLEYGFVRGNSHHQGIVLIAFLVSLWALWPTPSQLKQLPRTQYWVHQVFLGLLILTFAWQCNWSFHAVMNDWKKPYSGAQDAAEFLKTFQKEQERTIGIGFWAVGVQPYFDHNIFENYGGPNAPASHHWSLGFVNHADVVSYELIRNRPDLIVLGDEESLDQVRPLIEGFRTWDYKLIHVSDGTRFFKNTDGPHSLYLIFERTDHDP